VKAISKLSEPLDEGSETETEQSSLQDNPTSNERQLQAVTNEGEATESSEGYDPDTRASESPSGHRQPYDFDRGVKPQLIARPDQTTKGKFLLTRPQMSYDGIRVLPGPRHSVPASINRFLRDYQRDGVQFFYERWCEGRGGILGDDMGLGKGFPGCNRIRFPLAPLLILSSSQAKQSKSYHS
jgi:SNF2 family DNA or RNA helicase